VLAPCASGCESTKNECFVAVLDEQRITGTLTFPATMAQSERREDIDTSFAEPSRVPARCTACRPTGPFTFHFVIEHPPEIALDLTMPGIPEAADAPYATRYAELCTSPNVCDRLVDGAKLNANTKWECNAPDETYVSGECASSFDFEVAIDGEYFKGTLQLRRHEHLESSQSCL